MILYPDNIAQIMNRNISQQHIYLFYSSVVSKCNSIVSWMKLEPHLNQDPDGPEALYPDNIAQTMNRNIWQQQIYLFYSSVVSAL